ncbi:MAG TPA: molybdopterin-guanine dinucleotide biosynthesis protein B [Clostridia bacterium]|nr:molybdopterin-guanine dinucleotide biosynthesis protein B [Clostridia bacterium]
MKQVPLVSIVSARSGTGKTTFMEKLIAELVRRGYKVGAVKSDAHGFEIDKPGKDSWRFTQAGAVATAIVGPRKFAFIQETKTKKDLDEVAGLMQDVDLILVEGYKMAMKPRIEIVRAEKGREIISPPEYLVAVVTDIPDLTAPAPVFSFEDYPRVADLIVAKFLGTHEVLRA